MNIQILENRELLSGFGDIEGASKKLEGLSQNLSETGIPQQTLEILEKAINGALLDFKNGTFETAEKSIMRVIESEIAVLKSTPNLDPTILDLLNNWQSLYLEALRPIIAQVESIIGSVNVPVSIPTLETVVNAEL